MKGASDHHNQDILKHGYLLKKSEVLKKWNLRYFVLSKECLCYYRNEKESVRDDAPKELIFFNDMSVYIDELPDRQTKYCLKIVKKALSPKSASRTYLLSCFSEEERNEWLSAILYAKAISLVKDPKAWIGSRQETSTEELDFEFARFTLAVSLSFSAKEVLQRCRHTLSLSRNIPRSPSCFSVYDLNANKRLAVNSHWRNAISQETVLV